MLVQGIQIQSLWIHFSYFVDAKLRLCTYYIVGIPFFDMFVPFLLPFLYLQVLHFLVQNFSDRRKVGTFLARAATRARGNVNIFWHPLFKGRSREICSSLFACLNFSGPSLRLVRKVTFLSSLLLYFLFILYTI